LPIFRYEVLDNNGKTLRGAMDATTAEDVSHRLTTRGYRDIRITTASNTAIPAVSSPANSPSTVQAHRPP
jgi:type II secretory pathway component PulF